MPRSWTSGPHRRPTRVLLTVAQELALIDNLSALDNLILGHEPVRGPFIDRRRALAQAKQLEGQLGFELPWDALVADLSVAQKQQIEVLRLLMLGADTLIFDEPTAALAPPQVVTFLDLLKRLASEGRTVVFISHKLREVMAISDVVTVLRGGRQVGSFPVADVTVEKLSVLMVGESLGKDPADDNTPGAVVLEVRDVDYWDSNGVVRLRNVSHAFAAHAITGICGVTGNGQEQFVEVLAGLVSSQSGRILLGDSDIAGLDVAARRGAGIAYLPPDRKSEGLAQTASLVDNAVAGFQHRLATRGWLSRASAEGHARSLLADFDVLHGDIASPVSSLSGGNQQKLMLGREIMHAPTVLLAAQPTRGVDIGGIQRIHQLLRRERDRGAAVLLASEDLDELLQLSDEIIVFFGGQLVATFHRPFDRRAIGDAMVGVITTDA